MSTKKKQTKPEEATNAAEDENSALKRHVGEMVKRSESLTTYIQDLEVRHALLLKVLSMIGDGSPFDHLTNKMKAAAVSTLAEVARLPLRRV